MTDFNIALDSFVNGCQAIIDAYHAENHPESDFGTKLTVDPKGRKYARIVSSDNFSSRYVYCFVDKTNGNVLKSASWAAPAKGARGNIFNDDSGLGRMGPFGTGYNR